MTILPPSRSIALCQIGVVLSWKSHPPQPEGRSWPVTDQNVLQDEIISMAKFTLQGFLVSWHELVYTLVFLFPPLILLTSLSCYREHLPPNKPFDLPRPHLKFYFKGTLSKKLNTLTQATLILEGRPCHPLLPCKDYRPKPFSFYL